MKNAAIRSKIIISFGIVVLICCVFSVILTVQINSAINTLGTDKSETIDLLKSSLTVVFVFSLSAIIASVTLIIFLSKNISAPLKFLTGAIASIAETGNIYLEDEAYRTSKILNQRRDETGQMSRSVGDMLAMFREKIKSLNAVAAGDLTASIALRSGKDTIGTALVKMVESLNSMFREIQSASLQVSTVAHNLAEGADSLAAGTETQSESIEQLSADINTVAGKTTQNADMANKAAKLSHTIKELAEKSGMQMRDMIDAVNKINEASDAINRVMKVIDDIAFQTDILALNAAVEAARAGEAGKGFAVVAGEVRNLALKSQSAARDSEALIADSISKARLGAEIADETALSLTQIVEEINKSVNIIGEIALSSDEQATAITRINNGVSQVNLVVHQNTETAAESARSCGDMDKQSKLLQNLIARFKISK